MYRAPAAISTAAVAQTTAPVLTATRRHREDRRPRTTFARAGLSDSCRSPMLVAADLLNVTGAVYP